uniref:Borealin n=1 Tax=Ascaris lumbricoides TaxID=6252 RepID=A0A0M3I103_ASCLU
MKLCDFIAKMEQDKPAETPMMNRCRSGLRVENKENIVAGGHCLRNTRARGGREQKSAINNPTTSVPIATTARRAPKNGRLLVANTPMGPMRLPPMITPKIRDGNGRLLVANTPMGPMRLPPMITPKIRDGNGRLLVANTPMGPMRLPPMITPKIRDGGDLMCRALKPEEVAFSITGTPVLAVNAADNDAQHIAQMLQVDESQLTPETRGVVQGLKTVIRKMHENA